MPYFLIVGLEIGLFLLEAMLLIVTTILCCLTKDVPGALNEARNNLRGAFIRSFYVDPVLWLFCFAALVFFNIYLPADFLTSRSNLDYFIIVSYHLRDLCVCCSLPLGLRLL
jgi:hypothetical protein